MYIEGGNQVSNFLIFQDMYRSCFNDRRGAGESRRHPVRKLALAADYVVLLWRRAGLDNWLEMLLISGLRRKHFLHAENA